MDLTKFPILFCLVQIFVGTLCQDVTTSAPEIPDAPTAIILEKRNTTSITISWTGSADNYEVDVSPSPSSGDLPKETGSAMFVQSELTPGTQYEFSITAKEGDVSSKPATKSFYTVPIPPTKLTRADQGMTDSLNISWTKPTGGCPAVELTLDGGHPQTANGLFHVFKSLTPGKMYSVAAICVVEILNSSAVSQKFFTKPLPLKDIIKESTTNSSITVSWVNSTADQVYENIQVGLLGGIEKPLDKGTQNYTFENLKHGTEYTVELKTVSGDQKSSSKQLNITTNPEAPSDLKQSDESETSITVRWKTVSNQNKISGYQIRLLNGDVVINSATNNNISISATAHTFTDLEPGTQYEVYLQSFLPGSLLSARVEKMVATAPSEPRNLNITSKSHNDLRFSWSPASNEPEQYHITVKSGMDEVASGSTNQTSFHVTSKLMAGATYVIEVSSKKFEKMSSPLTQSVVLIPLPPESATVKSRTTTSITVQWTPPSKSNVAEYSLEWKIQGSASEGSKSVIGTEHTINGLSEGQDVVISVFSVNAAGARSVSSAQLTSSTLMGVLSITPESETTNSVTISWSEPQDSAVDSYDITLTPVSSGDKPQQVNVQGTESKEYTFNDLVPGSQYRIRIRATVGTGVAADKNATVETKPDKVGGVSATNVKSTTIDLNWSAGKGKTEKYKIICSSKSSGQKELETSDTQKTISTLTPGETYNITVTAISNNKRSEGVTITVTTVPSSVTNLEVVASTITATLSWKPGTDSMQDEFQYRFKKTGDSSFTMWSSTPDETAKIEVLIPGQAYTFEVRASSKNIPSTAESVSATLYPLAPETVIVVNKTTNSTFLEWKKNSLPSVVTKWQVNISSQDNRQIRNFSEDVSITFKDVQGLIPGALYSVEVRSFSGTVKSQGAATTSVQLKPVIDSQLTEFKANTTAIVVTYTESTKGTFTKYKFTLYTSSPPLYKNNGGSVNKTIERSKGDSSVTFTGLDPGTVYFVEAVTVSGNEESSPLRSKDITTVPVKPKVGAEQLSRRLTLKISPGNADHYTIKYIGPENLGILEVEVNVTAIGDAYTTKNYTNLEPNQKFTFTFVAWKNGKRSKDTVATFTTKEDKPGTVNGMNVMAFNPNSVKITWSEPLSPNGKLTGYTVRIKKVSQELVDIQNRSISEKIHTYENLTAGTEYHFEVSAWTRVGEGQLSIQRIITPIWGPKLKLNKEEAKPKVIGEATANTFDVSFRNPFSDQYGKVTSYTLIVTTNITLNSDPQKLTNWAVAHRKSSMGIYQVLEPCPLFESGSDCLMKGKKRSKRATQEELVFTIGAEECEESDLDSHCNGPVKPASQYFVKLRGFTERGNYTDTSYSRAVVTAKKPLQALLLKVLLPVFLILIALAAIFAVFIVRRKRKAERDSYLQDVYMQKRRKPVESSRPIIVAHFLDRVKELSADADFLYSEEFEDLKNVGRDQPTTAAELPVNRNKNRFTNILPYEHSRVKLLPTDDEEGSDYINANYVPGYNSKREFIACQGPLPSTKDDFWRMVWEQNARAVVMLTRCVEKGREKCDHYWPIDSEPVFYGDLQVAILNETQTPEWDIREFTMSKGQTSRRLTHFHYTAWPDFGVPGQPRSLVHFVRLVRERLEPQGGPIIVHCSAGVGRSGTYISLDTLLQQIKEGSDTIDIFGVVYAMRLQRVCMVQTEQQYICIHNCIACVLDGDDESQEEEPGEDNEGFEVDEGIDEN